MAPPVFDALVKPINILAVAVPGMETLATKAAAPVPSFMRRLPAEFTTPFEWTIQNELCLAEPFSVEESRAWF